MFYLVALGAIGVLYLIEKTRTSRQDPRGSKCNNTHYTDQWDPAYSRTSSQLFIEPPNPNSQNLTTQSQFNYYINQ
jgi:hypothetical protein